MQYILLTISYISIFLMGAILGYTQTLKHQPKFKKRPKQDPIQEAYEILNNIQ